jgi:regulation of enolase protein 1 (concanavalin A-like superfamily)
MQRLEHFLQPSLSQDFYWFNEPVRYRVGDGLEIFTDQKTDFWQRTHYGFQRDDGHCLLTRHTGDFSLTTRVEFQPREKYDQCGLIVRIDSQNWIKVSTEYESEQVSRLGSVVTNLGYSDWATQDVTSNYRAMWYRISKRGRDFLLENSYDGGVWLQMRVTHLHQEAAYYEIGVYACSPVGKDFRCCFKTLEIAENRWQAIPEDS